MMKSMWIVTISLLTLVFPTQAICEKTTFMDFIERDHLLGDLNNSRTWLEEHGICFDLVYTAEGFTNTRGGINTNDTEEYRGDVSLYIELDTETAGWWKGGTFFLHLQESHGYGITTEHVGDYQCISNIDADDFKQVSEFWFRQSFLDDLLWIKFGKMEATCDFTCGRCNVSGSEFINSSPGLIPTIPLPSYPDQDWGVVLGLNPNDWFSLHSGVYQGRNDGGRSIRHTSENLYGPMVIVEPIISGEIAGHKNDFHIGGWWHGDRFHNLESDDEDEDIWTFNENYGWYMMLNQELWCEKTEDEENFEGLGFFAQYGWTKDDRNEVDEYYGGGFTYEGAIPTRCDDVIGLGAFNVNFSDKAGFEKEFETAFELFFKVQLTGWMWLKPDLQYIMNPGGTENKDAIAAGIQIEVSL